MNLPGKVAMVEVGPRDGFQNVKTLIPTEKKIAIIESMIAAGVRQMEITSFVNSKWIPQMADASEVAKEIIATAPGDFRAIALAPNLRGVQNAVNAELKDVTYVVSASESHNKKNVNRTIAESMAELEEIKKQFREITIRVSLATSFGCPFEGKVPQEQVCSLVDKIVNTGVTEIVLCDTIGVANPLQVTELVSTILAQNPELSLGLHFHDTRGAGIANIFAGLSEGISMFETSVGGLGGCPFAPGSAGNTASEDMLNMLTGMGIEHGIDVEQYLKTVDLVRANVDGPITGRIANICKQ